MLAKKQEYGHLIRHGKKYITHAKEETGYYGYLKKLIQEI